MEKRYGILILGTFACAACFLLSACAGPAAEQSSVQPPYDGQTQDADVFIDMPGYVFYFNDPACVGYCMMSEQDLNNRWIDMDTEGNVYDHYGIEITADGTSYNPDGVFYLE